MVIKTAKNILGEVWYAIPHDMSDSQMYFMSTIYPSVCTSLNVESIFQSLCTNSECFLLCRIMRNAVTENSLVYESDGTAI